MAQAKTMAAIAKSISCFRKAKAPSCVRPVPRAHTDRGSSARSATARSALFDVRVYRFWQRRSLFRQGSTPFGAAPLASTFYCGALRFRLLLFSPLFGSSVVALFQQQLNAWRIQKEKLKFSSKKLAQP